MKAKVQKKTRAKRFDRVPPFVQIAIGDAAGLSALVGLDKAGRVWRYVMPFANATTGHWVIVPNDLKSYYDLQEGP